MQLIVATPSPFARKVRVALREKGIDADERIDLPWNPGAVAADFNPLGKIPILIPDQGPPVYDSGVIVEYLETLGHAPALIPAVPAARVRVRQLEALADGICDAVVLIVLETHRPASLQSADWIGRQQAKIDAGVAALARQLGDAQWFEGDDLSLADIAAGCMLGYLDLRLPDYDWRSGAPNLAAFAAKMEARPSFQATRPEVQDIAAVR